MNRFRWIYVIPAVHVPLHSSGSDSKSRFKFRGLQPSSFVTGRPRPRRKTKPRPPYDHAYPPLPSSNIYRPSDKFLNESRQVFSSPQFRPRRDVKLIQIRRNTFIFTDLLNLGEIKRIRSLAYQVSRIIGEPSKSGKRRRKFSILVDPNRKVFVHLLFYSEEDRFERSRSLLARRKHRPRCVRRSREPVAEITGRRAIMGVGMFR